MTYAGAWAHASCVLVGSGVGLAVLEWSPLVTGVAVATASGCAALVVVSVSMTREAVDGEGGARGFAAVASASFLAGTGIVGLFAVASAFPTLALLLVLLTGLSCPPVVRMVRRRLALSRPTPATRVQAHLPAAAAPSPPVSTDGVVRRLSDGELCVLWRRTFWQLSSLRTPEAVLAIVLLRQALLDELARRNPAAVHAWIESGGRASGGPERFWVPRHRHGDADTAW